MGAQKYKGKYIGKRKRRTPITAVVFSVVAVLAMSIGGVAAYLSTTAGPVENTFSADQAMDPSIAETFTDSKIKENVAINVGNPGYAVYVRAAVVVTWKESKNGSVLGQIPVEGTDYSISYNVDADDGWFKGSDGFFYHKKIVFFDGESDVTKLTDVLISECKPLKVAPAVDYELNVEIIAQTIQALGSTDAGDMPAVKDAWKVVQINKDGLLESVS